MPFDIRSRRAVLAVVIALLLVVFAPVGGLGKSVITLRLEEPNSSGSVSPSTQPSQAAPAGPNTSTPSQTPADITVSPSRRSLAPPPEIKAASAVVMDAATGEVLYAKNPHVRRPNASTTKIMTAILMIEKCRMTDTITASKNVSETPFTSLHLKEGEKILAKDLLVGMLVRSANDAAVAVAEHVAGSVPAFVNMMNRKAAQIGCEDTHFVTPNGLYDKDHYSSAYDLCLMARYALQYPLFNEAVNTRKYCLASRTMNKKTLPSIIRASF